MTAAWSLILALTRAAPGTPVEPSPTPVARTHDELRAVPCGEAPEGTACVPGGWFIRGVDEDPHWPCWQAGRPRKVPPDSVPASRVWTDTFYMDLTEVTVAAYRACVKAGACKRAGPSYSDFSRPGQPITGISWFDARQFCEAQGKHLPTEAEWEKAARGPDGELYPWGNEPANCERAVIRDDAKGGRSCGVEKHGGHPEKGRVLKVGSRPAGRYGLFDMVGNAEEWTADWYGESWAACGEPCQGINPRGPCPGADRCPGHPYKSVRGGSWYWPAVHAKGSHRRPHFPKNRPFHHYGFRCAANVTEAEALSASDPVE
jgi:formylglycine-generating enzyme required for sulfatase activity